MGILMQMGSRMLMGTPMPMGTLMRMESRVQTEASPLWDRKCRPSSFDSIAIGTLLYEGERAGIFMKIKHFLPLCLLAPMLWAMSLQTAGAETVLYNGTSVIQGRQAYVQSFNVTTPGTLTFSVSEIPWLDVVTDLNCFVSTSKGVVGSVMDTAGSETLNIGSGTFYAHWFGDAQGAYGAGVLGVKIQFQPAGPVVPLPSSLILMLSGLGLLGAWQWRRASILASR
jgi:PEP-CTERM motif